jgi:hypothetical protein
MDTDTAIVVAFAQMDIEEAAEAATTGAGIGTRAQVGASAPVPEATGHLHLPAEWSPHGYVDYCLETTMTYKVPDTVDKGPVVAACRGLFVLTGIPRSAVPSRFHFCDNLNVDMTTNVFLSSDKLMVLHHGARPAIWGVTTGRAPVVPCAHGWAHGYLHHFGGLGVLRALVAAHPGSALYLVNGLVPRLSLTYVPSKADDIALYDAEMLASCRADMVYPTKASLWIFEMEVAEVVVVSEHWGAHALHPVPTTWDEWDRVHGLHTEGRRVLLYTRDFDVPAISALAEWLRRDATLVVGAVCRAGGALEAFSMTTPLQIHGVTLKFPVKLLAAVRMPGRSTDDVWTRPRVP